jgi:hypothetical protein
MEGLSDKTIEVGKGGADSFDGSERQKRAWSRNRHQSMYLLEVVSKRPTRTQLWSSWRVRRSICAPTDRTACRSLNHVEFDNLGGEGLGEGGENGGGLAF